MPEYTGFGRKKLVADGDAAPLAKAAFVELGVASPFSFLRGASDAIELVLAAHEMGMDAIGIADRNTLAGVVRMHSAAKGAGLRPLIGCRLDLVGAVSLYAYPIDREGRRFWIFREGVHGDGRGGEPAWYLHGVFG